MNRQLLFETAKTKANRAGEKNLVLDGLPEPPKEAHRPDGRKRIKKLIRLGNQHQRLKDELLTLKAKMRELKETGPQHEYEKIQAKVRALAGKINAIKSELEALE